MSIGTTIKQLRKEKSWTQEQLAEYLGVSAQAVSSWECDKYAPDISQLPILANIFDVSTDELLEVNVINKKRNIEAIIRTVKEEYVYNSKWQEAVDALYKGLKKYPSSHELMYELSNSIVCFNSRNGIKDYGEAYSLCNRILSQSTDSVLRYKTLSLLALAYSYADDSYNMRRVVAQMPSASESKESFMVWRNLDAEGDRKNKEYLVFLISEVLSVLDVLSMSSKLFSAEEKGELLKQEISLIESMFPHGDYGSFAQFAEGATARLAAICHEKGDVEQFFYWLDRHCEFSVYSDTYDGEQGHTSPAFRGYAFDGLIREEGMSRGEQNIKMWMRGDTYDDVKGDMRFIEAMNKLKFVM